MIKCGHCKARHSTVNEIRQCAAPVMPAPTRAPIHAVRLQDAVAEIRSAQPATEGMYRKGGEIYKIQRAVHGSGHLYVKHLNVETQSFEYAPGMLRQLTMADRLTMEEAKAYGALYGVCCVCARTLTNEESIAAGIGPICAGRLDY
jgi:hypothetical protein